MHYSIRHITKFRYSNPVSESVTELRMQPRSDGGQRCVSFELNVSPRARVASHRDHLGNTVHHFDIPRHHGHLTLATRSVVETTPPPYIPKESEPGAWEALDAMTAADDFCDFLFPSHFAHTTPALTALGAELAVDRATNPLALVWRLNSDIYRVFDYVPQSTKVDSPIGHALEARKGVCQDFAHIFIALARGVGIPCRYVSGYLYHRTEDGDRSAVDATHAWVEVCLPELGWTGFDPTNDLLAGDRHIRVAVGRDYADVPPTRGVFKGQAKSELSVAVKVQPAEAPVSTMESMEPITVATYSPPEMEEEEEYALQRQRQQQQ